MITDKEEALRCIKDNEIRLINISDELRNDKDVVLEGVKNDGFRLNMHLTD